MMMLGCAPINTADKVYSITPSTMPVGAVTSLPGFTLGGDSLGVTNVSAYGVTGKVFGWYPWDFGAGEHTEAIFETTAQGRDVVVTTWARLGCIYLRSDRVTGRAIIIKWTGQAAGGTLSVSFATNIASTLAGVIGNYTTTGTVSLFSTNDLSSIVTGWDPDDTTGDEFEFSLIGHTLTVKWNSQTIYENSDIWFHLKPGKVMFATTIAEGALRDTTITFKANTPISTDGDNAILDFSDFGWKTISTIGSMSAASTALTVASATGFAIGDPIYVATGGEAGAGLKNTVGVGGSWPKDSVANVASLPDAATYRAANGNQDCWIWVESEQATYGAFVGGWAEWTDYVLADSTRSRGFWHTIWRVPKGLSATITNISGNTLTLDTPSVAATTDAEVFYDCSATIGRIMPDSMFEYAAANAVSDDGWTIQFPAGTSCLRSVQQTPFSNNWKIEGKGAANTLLYGPKGSRHATVKMNGNSFEIRDFKVKGWAGVSYWGHDEENTYPSVGSHGAASGGTYKAGGLIENCDFENTIGGALTETRFGSIIRNCNGLQTNGNLQQYASWFFQMAYNDPESWIEDCTYTATELGTAFEIFQQSSGGMRRCTSVQGAVASNFSGDDWLIDEMDVSIDWNNTPTENDWIASGTPAININTNIGEGGYNQDFNGGTIRNPTINIVKRTSDGYIYDAININGGAFNVHVEGTHIAKPGTGVITMSDYESGDAGNGAVGIRIDTPECSVRGIRVIGIDSGSFANISAYGDGDDCIIEDCVAETIEIDGVDQLGTNGNITNATYEAL